MRVRVRFFASLREAAGVNELALDLPSPSTVETCFAALADRFPPIGKKRPRLSASINRQYASFDASLSEGDEVVFIPPVSGG